MAAARPGRVRRWPCGGEEATRARSVGRGVASAGGKGLPGGGYHMPKQGPRLAGTALLLALLPLLGGVTGQALAAGALDEAKQVGRGPESFPPAAEDYFRETDNG